jgi:mannitol/fructose-specific phosphotransferase system IIA component (Ntr-type)
VWAARWPCAAMFVALGRSERGIPVGSAGALVELLFLVMTPAAQPDTGTWVRAEIARICESDYLRAALRAAATPDEAWAAIRTAEQVVPA